MMKTPSQTVHSKVANCNVGKLQPMYWAPLPTAEFELLTLQSNGYGVPIEVMNSQGTSKPSILWSVHKAMFQKTRIPYG